MMVEPADFGGFFDSPHLMVRTLNPDLGKSCRSASSDAGRALMNRAQFKISTGPANCAISAKKLQAQARVLPLERRLGQAGRIAVPVRPLHALVQLVLRVRNVPAFLQLRGGEDPGYGAFVSVGLKT